MDIQERRNRYLKRRIVLVDCKIDGDWFNYAHKSLLDLDEHSKKKITLLVRSSGGLTDAGLLIHDTLRMLRSPTEAIVFIASSSAVNIVQGCDDRVIVRSGKILVHSPTPGDIPQLGEFYKEHVECNEEAARIGKARMESIITERTGLPLKELRKLIRQGDRYNRSMYAQEAQKLNFVDRIISDKPDLFK